MRSERIIRSLAPAEVVTVRDTARRLGCSIFTLLSYVFGNIIRKKNDAHEILLGITAAGQLTTSIRVSALLTSLVFIRYQMIFRHPGTSLNLITH